MNRMELAERLRGIGTAIREGRADHMGDDCADALEEAATLLERLSSSEVTEEWLPIESAPKDGTSELKALIDELRNPRHRGFDNEDLMLEAAAALESFTRTNPDGLREALEEAREAIGIYGYATVHGRRVRQSWATEALAKIDAALTSS